MNVFYPLQINLQGRTRLADDEAHIRQMIEQILFTNPGERLNRYDFGSGLLQLVFAPNSDELAVAVQSSVHASLQRWLGDVIEAQELTVTNDDATLTVVVRYAVRRTGEVRTVELQRGLQ